MHDGVAYCNMVSKRRKLILLQQHKYITCTNCKALVTKECRDVIGYTAKCLLGYSLQKDTLIEHEMHYMFRPAELCSKPLSKDELAFTKEYCRKHIRKRKKANEST